MSAFGIEIDKKCVCLFRDGETKETALDRMVDGVAKTGAVSDVTALRVAIRERENVRSTGIGSGVAIPHVRIDSMQKPILGIGISRTGVEFSSVDGKPARIIVLFAMPTDSNRLYLRLLAQVMVALKVPNFVERLTAAETEDEVVALLNESGG